MCVINILYMNHYYICTYIYCLYIHFSDYFKIQFLITPYNYHQKCKWWWSCFVHDEQRNYSFVHNQEHNQAEFIKAWPTASHWRCRSLRHIGDNSTNTPITYIKMLLSSSRFTLDWTSLWDKDLSLRCFTHLSFPLLSNVLFHHFSSWFSLH